MSAAGVRSTTGDDRFVLGLAAGVALALLRQRRLELSIHGVDRPGANHQGHTPGDYDAVVAEMTSMIAAAVPDGAEVLVVSRGDERLLRVEPALGRHFPTNDLGVWAGHHPAVGTAAALVEAQRGGADHFALPSTAFWWLETYPELAHLLAQGERCAHDERVGSLWRLPARTPAARAAAQSAPGVELTRYRAQLLALLRVLGALVVPGDVVAIASRGDDEYLALATVSARHFPCDHLGRYDGHPVDDHDALLRLQSEVGAGVSWLAVPADSAWWATHYRGFWKHLEDDHQVVSDRPEIGRIVRLRRRDRGAAGPQEDR